MLLVSSSRNATPSTKKCGLNWRTDVPLRTAARADQQDGERDDDGDREAVVRRDEAILEVQERPVVGRRRGRAGKVEGVDLITRGRRAVQPRDERTGGERRRRAAMDAHDRRAAEAALEHPGDLLGQPVLAVEVVHDEDPVRRRVDRGLR